MPDIGLLQGAPPRPIPAAPAADVARAAVIAMTAAPDVAILREPVAAEEIVLATAPVVSAGGPRSTAPGSAAEPAALLSDNGLSGNGLPVTVPPAAPLAWRDLLWLALALALIIGTGLGIRDPWPADEPRFAAVARDMVLSHEWLFPRVGGDLYQDKPPVFFWLLALCYWLTGSVKAAFLVPSFLASGGVLFLIHDFGRRLVSRFAGLAAALLVVSTLLFVLTMRGAQIDPTLCFLTTLSLYAFLRHFLLGPSWRWYFIGGFAAGLGVITKGVGFLPVLTLLPFFTLRALRFNGLAPIDAGRGGWRWWIAPLAMLAAISLWFVPMLLAVAAQGPGEYTAYRDEILFRQTVGRYAASWHHVKSWYYFIAEVIPLLWLPWSLLLLWLVPRFKGAWASRDARVWLPLLWLLLVVLFFSISPGKRGVYILPALPALAFAALPFLEEVLARASVRRLGFALAGLFFVAALALAVGTLMQVHFVMQLLAEANQPNGMAIYVYLALAGVGLVLAYRRAPLAAWPVALGALAFVFSYYLAPAMNAERSGRGFTRAVLTQVAPGETLALVAYKEQFLLYLDRPTVNFGHRRFLEGPQEGYDAAAWLNAAANRVLLVPNETLKPCFPGGTVLAGTSAGEDWFLVRGHASDDCAAKGDAKRAIRYDVMSGAAR